MMVLVLLYQGEAKFWASWFHNKCLIILVSSANVD